LLEITNEKVILYKVNIANIGKIFSGTMPCTRFGAHFTHAGYYKIIFVSCCHVIY